MSVKDAEKSLKELNLELEVISNGETDKDMIIQEQIPAEGIKINSGKKIKCK